MSYKYYEVAALIKKVRKEKFPMPKYAVPLIILGVVGFVLTFSGALIYNVFKKDYGIALFSIGFSLIWIFIALSYVAHSSRQSKREQEIKDFLNKAKKQLQDMGMTSGDLVTLQAEIRQSMEQSDGQWTRTLGTVKWAFSVCCITPVSFTLATSLKPILENSLLQDERLWQNLLINIFLIGILATITVVTLTCFINCVRKELNPYQQKQQVYSCLEDMKYLL